MIKVKDVTKVYKIYANPFDRFKEKIFKKKLHRDFFALKNVTFSLKKGESLGIIGKNGAGKSTLLKILTGVLSPTSGEVFVEGRVASLLELGAGFNPEFTGIENIYFQGLLMGYPKKEMDKKIDEIVEFADIGDFINQPVKFYSSGMFARLAFSVATAVEPDILIVDEALSVGDGSFAKKSFDKILKMKESGVTTIFCSHSMYQIETLCDKSLWLNKGEIAGFGESQKVVSEYQAFLESSLNKSIKDREVDSELGYIKKIEVLKNGKSKELEFISGQDSMKIYVEYFLSPKLSDPNIGWIIKDKNGKFITSAATLYDNIELKRDKEGFGKVEIVLPNLPLMKGEYYLEFYLLCDKGIFEYDSIYNAVKFKVKQKNPELGVVHIPREWKIVA